MKKSTVMISVVGWGWFFWLAAPAQAQPATASANPTPAENPAHEQLRQLRREVIEAVGKNDLTGMIAHMHPNVVITWLNGEQSRGHQQVREYYQRMMQGDHPIVKTFNIDDVKVKELTLLYGDNMGVAYGTAKSHFVLTSGTDVTIEGPWTAVVVKENGKWSLAALHSSANLFDNPVLEQTKGLLYWFAAGGVGAGLLLALLLTKIAKRGGRLPVTPGKSR